MTLTPSDLTTFFDSGTLLYIKVALLILIALYAIFTLMLAVKIRSLDKTVFLPTESGEGILRFFAYLYFIVIVFLFIATIVIV
jgi:hypothetical protein